MGDKKFILKRYFERQAVSKSERQQHRYLSQSIRLEESISPYVVHFTMFMISASVALFLIWAALTEIDEVARAGGKVVPKGYVQAVQHLDGGLIKEICVKDGEIVKENDTLLRIDDGRAKHELAEANAKQVSLELQAERLQAFLNQTKPDFNSIASNSEIIIRQQEKSYKSMMKAREQERVILRDQLSQRKDEIEVFRARKKSIEDNLKLSLEAKELQGKLMDKGYTSKLTYIKYQKEANELGGQLNETKKEIKRMSGVIEEYENRLLSLDAKHRDDAYQELDQINSKIAQNKAVIMNLEERVGRLEVLAPVSGIVTGINVNTINGVVKPGETLMEIVPLDQNMIVEAHVSPNDIGHLEIGQSVRVKVSSYDFSRYGAVEGELEFLSAMTFSDDLGKSYYRARIILDQNYVGNNSEMNIILPAMEVEVDILTGKKSILAYLLKPIHQSVKTAFSER